jgi:phage-related protein
MPEVIGPEIFILLPVVVREVQRLKALLDVPELAEDLLTPFLRGIVWELQHLGLGLRRGRSVFLLVTYDFMRLPCRVAVAPLQSYQKRYIMAWTVEFLDEGIAGEFKQQPADIRARLSRIIALIEQNGLANVHGPYVKHIRGPLWEMRASGRNGIARALYVTARGERVFIVRVFTKKTQATPDRETDLALKRAKEVR